MQTDLRYFFHVNLIFTAIDLDDEMPVSCLFDEICRQVLDAVAGLKEMDVYGPAGVADEVLVLLEDAVQSRRRYFQEIVVADRVLFVEDLAQLLADGLAVFQVDTTFLISPFDNLFYFLGNLIFNVITSHRIHQLIFKISYR